MALRSRPESEEQWPIGTEEEHWPIAGGVEQPLELASLHMHYNLRDDLPLDGITNLMYYQPENPNLAPEQTVPCPRCNQRLTVKGDQNQYGCPVCRGVFDTGTFRLVAELQDDPNAPICRSF